MGMESAEDGGVRDMPLDSQELEVDPISLYIYILWGHKVGTCRYHLYT